jgi:hypothetical protein
LARSSDHKTALSEAICAVHFYKGSLLIRITLCIALVMFAATFAKPTFLTLHRMYLQQTAAIWVSPRSEISGTIEGNAKPNIRVESTLVLIPVTVVDPLYRFVSGLRKRIFG